MSWKVSDKDDECRVDSPDEQQFCTNHIRAIDSGEAFVTGSLRLQNSNTTVSSWTRVTLTGLSYEAMHPPARNKRKAPDLDDNDSKSKAAKPNEDVAMSKPQAGEEAWPKIDMEAAFLELEAEIMGHGSVKPEHIATAIPLATNSESDATAKSPNKESPKPRGAEPVKPTKSKKTKAMTKIRISPVDGFNNPQMLRTARTFEKNMMTDQDGALWLIPAITYSFEEVKWMQERRQAEDGVPVSPKTVASFEQMNAVERELRR
ncbi:hypothetical protein LTR97_007970 [Elasticomyces elasticus]|uniref:Uncharacterized protein n=1 Tax=Elasticomyces elasticus TaxID=574655 RepID=A0AAN8A1W9_9PEZI|nr:hypothetical protein LTR97_007970 [Elasticomyces elasticus]